MTSKDSRDSWDEGCTEHDLVNLIATGMIKRVLNIKIV